MTDFDAKDGNKQETVCELNGSGLGAVTGPTVPAAAID